MVNKRGREEASAGVHGVMKLHLASDLLHQSSPLHLAWHEPFCFLRPSDSKTPINNLRRQFGAEIQPNDDPIACCRAFAFPSV